MLPTPRRDDGELEAAAESGEPTISIDGIFGEIALYDGHVLGAAARSGDSWSRCLIGQRGHDGFVFDRGQLAEDALASTAVVGAFDPGDDRDAQRLAGVPTLPVEDVALQQ